jgi:hypothetical protein
VAVSDDFAGVCANCLKPFRRGEQPQHVTPPPEVYRCPTHPDAHDVGDLRQWTTRDD